jgi:hypothetical protein
MQEVGEPEGKGAVAEARRAAHLGDYFCARLGLALTKHDEKILQPVSTQSGVEVQPIFVAYDAAPVIRYWLVTRHGILYS